MSYAIIGLGKIGEAIARAFARTNIEVAITGRRKLEALAPLAEAIGPTIIAKSMHDALQADIVILAVPFDAHSDVARAAPDWHGKIVIDTTNAFGVPPEDLADRPSSVVVAHAFTGAKLVKAFNHLPAKTLAQDPNVHGGRRVVFLSGDDEAATARVADLAKQLGFAPVDLGRLDEGGRLVQARGRVWAPLIFQDLVKFD
jgi:predicted dinucleotide-binding enzyme